MSTKRTGDRGEALAAAYLEERGWRVLDRNYRFERAELDLVCYEPAAGDAEGGTIVFVEVKARSGLGYGRPEEAVTPSKQQQLVRAARAYLYERELLSAPVRFDVVSLLVPPGQPPAVEHFRHAFEAGAP